MQIKDVCRVMVPHGIGNALIKVLMHLITIIDGTCSSSLLPKWILAR